MELLIGKKQMLAEMWIIEENRLLLPCKNLNNFRIIFFPSCTTEFREKENMKFRSSLSKTDFTWTFARFLYSLCTRLSSDSYICVMLHDFSLFGCFFFSLVGSACACVQQSNHKKCNKISSRSLDCQLRVAVIRMGFCVPKIVISFFLFFSKWHIHK